METSSGESSSPLRWSNRPLVVLRGMGLVHLVALVALGATLVSSASMAFLRSTMLWRSFRTWLLAMRTIPVAFPNSLLAAGPQPDPACARWTEASHPLLFFGLAPRLMLVLLWSIYLSFFTVTSLLDSSGTFSFSKYSLSNSLCTKWMVYKIKRRTRTASLDGLTLRFLLFKLVISSGL